VKILFKESFAKDLEKITNRELATQVRGVIESIEKARTLREIPHIKKLRESSNCFRIRVGQYRIGLLAEKNEIIFVRCLHRRDVYRYFP
jgi:mRNA interferase RelE/StbE